MYKGPEWLKSGSSQVQVLTKKGDAMPHPIIKKSAIFKSALIISLLLLATIPALAQQDKDEMPDKTFKNIKDLTLPSVCSVRPEVPKELDLIVSKAIDRDINKRYQTPTEFRRALEALF